MILFLAAGFGNLLAWLVHGTSWWLRKRYADLTLIIGGLCFYMYFFWLCYLWDSDDLGHDSVVLLIIILFFPTVFGLWQYRVREMRMKTIWHSIFAFYGELCVGLVIVNICIQAFEEYAPAPLLNRYHTSTANVGTSFSVMFLETMLFAAIFHKPIVRIWQFGLSQLRGDSREPGT